MRGRSPGLSGSVWVWVCGIAIWLVESAIGCYTSIGLKAVKRSQLCASILYGIFTVLQTDYFIVEVFPLLIFSLLWSELLGCACQIERERERLYQPNFSIHYFSENLQMEQYSRSVTDNSNNTPLWFIIEWLTRQNELRHALPTAAPSKQFYMGMLANEKSGRPVRLYFFPSAFHSMYWKERR